MKTRTARWFSAPVITSALLVAASALAVVGAPPAGAYLGPQGAPACTVEQLSHTTGSHAPEVDVDADGDRIAVTSLNGLDGGNIGGNVEVWLWSPGLRSEANPDGFRQLTETQTGTATSVALSDDGQVVAFSTGANLVASTNADGNQEVFSWNLGQGSLEQQSFTAGGAGNQGVALSGDGSTMAWHSDRDLIGQNPTRRPQIYELDVATPGAVEQQVTAVPAGRSAADPALSEDGSTLAFTSDMPITGGNTDGGVEQWRAGPLGGFEMLTTSPMTGGFQQPVDLSADGRTAVFSDRRTLGGANGDLTREIWANRSGQLQSLTDEAEGASAAPSVDAAGQRIAFTSTSRITFDEAGDETTPDLFVQDLNTGKAAQLTTPGVATTYAGNAAVSADGTRIAFVSDQRTPGNDDGNRELFLATCGRPDQVFLDVAVVHPFFGEIGWMAERGISEGYQPGPTYRPAAVVTRAAMSAFLFRLGGTDRGEVDLPPTPTFRDVGPNHPFRLEIEWMADREISTGYPGGTFRPSDPVSRGAMSAFLYRFAERPTITLPPTPSFTDVGANHPFRLEIEWMALKGISTGYSEPDGSRTYRSADAVTRQAMSAFLQRTAVAYPNVGQV